ncbi:hypothetical protein PHYSODRAFT_502046 [Phytophthora sojae]|uniref:CCHC-type domain-containing protein n=1 Tax=Phytophthora sojae (strain P6497) TaxID=1094619 RepID=G4ZH18_PHYSP|nr:hypothetical protein PHYSODRAFT_502046 [Phytophthora sojae]EGZ18643.1 hypothetical protein PHYSODRAFT_502046 [Phytophthora sojae]|eukprot:XP_009527701.1 hypothetical protein PHYSODRAFT_502046 [Phytophthora sojae]
MHAKRTRYAQHQLREGSDDEWKIIQGLAEGSIVSRRLPDFIRSILDSQERLRLYSTIQAQVEGELMFVLNGYTGVRVSRQHTRAFQEDILLAAERANVNLTELHGLLSQTKTISFNRVKKSIHFFFFDRATAARHALTPVPFKGRVYRLMNVHGPDRGTPWERQLGRAGVSMSPPTEYEVRLYNITRFMDIGRLTAFFKKHSQAEFDFEDLDACTPNSRTSTVWKLTFKLAGCPEFLRGIQRIIWFGASIVIKHPAVGRRLQCLRCGQLGHTLARCNYTDDQLSGQGDWWLVKRR